MKRWRASLCDEPADCCRTRKANNRHVFTSRQRRSSAGPIAAHDVHHTRRNPSLSQNLDQVIRRQRRILSGLQHHRIPADQRRRHLPRRDRHRKIPRRNHSAYANRLPHAHRKLIRQLGRSRLAKQPPPFARHVIRHINGFLHVAARLRQNLPHLARHVLGKFFLALYKQFRRAIENLRPLWRRNQAPLFVCLFGSVHRRVHVLRRRRHKHPDQLIRVRRIAVLVRLTAARFHPLAVNEILENSRRYRRSHTCSSVALKFRSESLVVPAGFNTGHHRAESKFYSPFLLPSNRASWVSKSCPISHRFIDLLLVELRWNSRTHEISLRECKALWCH